VDGRDVGGGVVLLGIAEVEDVVLPLVIFPALILPLAVAVLFPDVAFCANVDNVVKFSAIITLAANTAAAIKPNLKVFCIRCLMVSILFIDLYYDIYIRNIQSVNTISFVFL
jgi:hypothetical protein